VSLYIVTVPSFFQFPHGNWACSHSNFHLRHHPPPHGPQIQIGSLQSDAAAGRHQGLKIFSASIIRASALNTGIYIRRAHVCRCTRMRVHAPVSVHTPTYRASKSIDARQKEQINFMA